VRIKGRGVLCKGEEKEIRGECSLDANADAGVGFSAHTCVECSYSILNYCMALQLYILLLELKS